MPAEESGESIQDNNVEDLLNNVEDLLNNVEDLLNKCESAVWSERKDGLLGLQSYLQRHGSIPSKHFNRFVQMCCRIFMDANSDVVDAILKEINPPDENNNSRGTE